VLQKHPQLEAKKLVWACAAGGLLIVFCSFSIQAENSICWLKANIYFFDNSGSNKDSRTSRAAFAYSNN